MTKTKTTSRGLRWHIAYLIIKCRQKLRTNASTREGRRRVPFPTRVSQEEQSALRIWSSVVHHPDSNLMYDPQTYESYAEYQGPGGPIYLFLESRGMRVVNSVVGYDVRLGQTSEMYATSVFNMEIHKRRSHFKADVNAKVHHSLANLEDRLHIAGVEGTVSAIQQVLQHQN